MIRCHRCHIRTCRRIGACITEDNLHARLSIPTCRWPSLYAVLAGGISPETMVALLSVLTSLETLTLEFQFLRPLPGWESRSLPLPKRSILPVRCPDLNRRQVLLFHVGRRALGAQRTEEDYLWNAKLYFTRGIVYTGKRTQHRGSNHGRHRHNSDSIAGDTVGHHPYGTSSRSWLPYFLPTPPRAQGRATVGPPLVTINSAIDP